jgi:hypothetical protein
MWHKHLERDTKLHLCYLIEGVYVTFDVICYHVQGVYVTFDVICYFVQGVYVTCCLIFSSAQKDNIKVT